VGRKERYAMAQREATERMSESGAAKQPDGIEPFKRWTAKRKAAVVLDLIKGKTTPAEVARRHDVTVGEVEKWLETFSQAGEEALRANPRDVVERFEAEKKELCAKIGELTLELDVEKKRTAAVLRGCGDGPS